METREKLRWGFRDLCHLVPMPSSVDMRMEHPSHFAFIPMEMRMEHPSSPSPFPGVTFWCLLPAGNLLEDFFF